MNRPTDVPCFKCRGTGEHNDADAAEHGQRKCVSCLGTGVHETLLNWHNGAAKRYLIVDRERPCRACNGGEYWECGSCLGSGFAEAEPPKEGWYTLLRDCPWVVVGHPVLR